MGRERGQSTVEWVGLLALVALLLVSLLVAGVRVPGATLAQAMATRVLCAAMIGDGCDEPELISAYGDEIGRLVRAHMPTLAFDGDSHGLPVDWRRCRSTDCADGPGSGPVLRTDAGLPVTAFVHVVDRRPKGNLYIQYWLYYADSATFRGVPIAEDEGFHRDDWESVQVRIGADGDVEERASSHHGYNYRRAAANLASDAGFGALREAEEAVGLRAANGWGPETGVLLVSGGSHAGNLGDDPGVRFTPPAAVRLVPLEPIASSDSTRFAISPPWRKRVWRDPEAAGTD
jgi:hypothetical protein